MSLSETSTENMKNFVLVNQSKGILCHDDCHPCYGMTVDTYEGWLGTHWVHIEHIGGKDWFNLKVDYEKLIWDLSLADMVAYLEMRCGF